MVSMLIPFRIMLHSRTSSLVLIGYFLSEPSPIRLNWMTNKREIIMIYNQGYGEKIKLGENKIKQSNIIKWT